MSGTVAKILEEVRELSSGERRELEAALRTLDAKPRRVLTEEQLHQQMAAEGRLTLPTRPLQKAAPVPCVGKPVSDVIIEERR